MQTDKSIKLTSPPIHTSSHTHTHAEGSTWTQLRRSQHELDNQLRTTSFFSYFSPLPKRHFPRLPHGNLRLCARLRSLPLRSAPQAGPAGPYFMCIWWWSRPRLPEAASAPTARRPAWPLTSTAARRRCSLHARVGRTHPGSAPWPDSPGRHPGPWPWRRRRGTEERATGDLGRKNEKLNGGVGRRKNRQGGGGGWQ